MRFAWLAALLLAATAFADPVTISWPRPIDEFVWTFVAQYPAACPVGALPYSAYDLVPASGRTWQRFEQPQATCYCYVVAPWRYDWPLDEPSQFERCTAGAGGCH